MSWTLWKLENFPFLISQTNHRVWRRLLLVSAAFLAVLFLVWYFRVPELPCAVCEMKLSKFQQLEDLEREWRTGCPEAGQGARGVVVTVVPGGRLGNQVFEYLSVWSVARRWGVWPAVPRSLLLTLRPVFPALSVPSLEDLAARCHLKHLAGTYNKLKAHGNKESLRSEIESQDGSSTRVSLVVWPMYSLDRDSFLPFWREMRTQIKFSEELQEQAREALAAAERDVRSRAVSPWSSDARPEFVGVHVRRTDYIAYVKRKLPGSRPADERFFLAAMDRMRAHFVGRRTVMVVVSDDLAWCRKQLQGSDVTFPGTGDIGRPWLDLAILAACNHTVFAYGTFALTAAMHHPDGRTIVYDPEPKDGRKNGAMDVAANLPGWSLLRVDQNLTLNPEMANKRP